MTNYNAEEVPKISMLTSVSKVAIILLVGDLEGFIRMQVHETLRVSILLHIGEVPPHFVSEVIKEILIYLHRLALGYGGITMVSSERKLTHSFLPNYGEGGDVVQIIVKVMPREEINFPVIITTMEAKKRALN